jgi:hypothetical protein
MPMPVMQHGFASGELSPSLYGRVDLAKYHMATALLRNFQVDYRGGASTRAGTQFCARAKDSSHAVRMVGFQFNTLQTYALEFGHLYMRVYINAAPVLEPTFNISAVTQANPAQVTAVGHNFVNGDTVFITGVAGMTQINGKTFLVTGVAGNNFTLTDLDGVNVDSTAWGAWTAGGTVGRVYTLTTTYQGADLSLLKFSQSADTMTITHPSYPPANLTRTQHYAWTLTNITFTPGITAPTMPTAVPSTAGTTNLQYVITAVLPSGEESVASAIATAASVNISTTAGAYVTVGWAAVAGASSYNIYRAVLVPAGTPPVGSLFGFIGSALGVAFIDNNILPSFSITPPQAQNPFANNNDPGCSAYFQQRRLYGGGSQFPLNLWGSKTGAYNNMDQSVIAQADDAFAATLVSGQVNAVQWIVPMNSLLVLTSSGAWQVSGAGTIDSVITPQNIVAVPQAYNGANDRVPPIVINYDVLYVQSKGSIVRDLAYNFYVNIYTGSDMTVLSNHLFYGHQIVEWAWCEEPFKIIWAVREDGILLSFTYMKEQDIYGWARHDTNGQFLSVCSIAEGVLNQQENRLYLVVQRFINGKYVKYIERMASRIWNPTTAINPNTGAPQTISDVTKAWCVDAGLQYPQTTFAAQLFPTALNGTANITAVNLTVGGHGYTAPAVVISDPTGVGANITASVAGGVITGFNVLASGSGYTNPALTILDSTGSGCVAWPIITNIVPFSTDVAVTVHVGDILQALGGTATVTTVTDTTHFSANVTVPLSMLAPVPAGAWTCTTPVTTVGGLDHLANQTVQILADGNVQTPQVVTSTNGVWGFTLPQAAAAITAGLGYTCQLQTLRLDDHGQVTVQGRRKKLGAVTARVQDTRGLKMGNTFNTLVEMKERTYEPYGQAVALITGDERIVLDPLWKVEGQVCFQQDYPLPATILAVIPEVTVGDTVAP